MQFLFFAGCLTTLLLLDDFLLWHEVVLPYLLGISEKVVYTVYVLLTLTYLIRFRDPIRNSGYGLLLLSGVFFASSVLLDLKLHSSDFKSLTEDGAKLLGIATWSAFHIRTAWLSVTRAVAS